MIKKRIINLAVALASISGFAVASPMVLAVSNSNAHNHVTICHATGSETNPYVQISPDANGVINGHVNHQDVNDIIPSFDYNDHGTIKHFAGQNLTEEGLAILHNGCHVPQGGQGGGCVPGNDFHPCHEDGNHENHPATGGMGGGEVLAANTAATPTGGQGAAVAAVPQGGVAAGVGGVSTLNIAALTGLTASVASLGFGIRRLSKS